MEIPQFSARVWAINCTKRGELLILVQTESLDLDEKSMNSGNQG